jgi:hypothetical protein
MRRALPWIAPAALGLLLSVAQVRCAGGHDLRLRALAAVLGGHSDAHDPRPSVAAARALRADRRARIYDPARTVGAAFIYPPIAAAMYAPVARLDPPRLKQALEIANRVLLVAIGVLFLAVATRGRDVKPWEVAVGAAALLVHYPLARAVELNQATVVVTLFLGSAWLAIQEGRARAAGVALALATAIKPHYVLMLPLLALGAGQQRRAAAWTLLAGAALAALSLAYAGVRNHLDYVTEVLPTLTNGYAFYPNHSWNGLWNRLLHPMLALDHFALAPPSGAVRALSAVSSALTYAVGLGLAWRWRRVGGPPAWRFGFAWLVATLVSPIAWEHHYAPALFLFASLWAVAREGWRLPRWLPAAAGVSFALIAGYFEVRRLEGAAARLLVSYVFLGALLLAAIVALGLERRAAERV